MIAGRRNRNPNKQTTPSGVKVRSGLRAKRSQTIFGRSLQDPGRFDIDAFQGHLQSVLVWGNGKRGGAIDQFVID